MLYNVLINIDVTIMSLIIPHCMSTISEVLQSIICFYQYQVWQSLLSLVGRGNPPLHVRNFFEIVRGMVDKRINTAVSFI